MREPGGTRSSTSCLRRSTPRSRVRTLSMRTRSPSFTSTIGLMDRSAPNAAWAPETRPPRRSGGRLLRRRELLVVLGRRHVDAGREVLVAEEDMNRQQAEVELALHLVGHR